MPASSGPLGTTHERKRPMLRGLNRWLERFPLFNSPKSFGGTPRRPTSKISKSGHSDCADTLLAAGSTVDLREHASPGLGEGVLEANRWGDCTGDSALWFE